MGRSFDELVAEAEAAPVDGWDFGWLDGRATEQRPSWGYARAMSRRLADPAVGGCARHPDRRRRGARRRAGVPPADGRHRGLAAEPGQGHGVAAPARRGRGGRRRRAAAAVRRRGVRPRRQPSSGHRVVDRDRPGAAPRWHLLLPAGRAGQRVRGGRVVPRTATRRGPPSAPPGSGPCRGRGRRVGGGRPAHGAAAHRVLRHRRGRVVPAPGDLDGAGVHRRGPPAGAAPAARADRGRRPVRRHDHADARRVPQAADSSG